MVAHPAEALACMKQQRQPRLSHVAEYAKGPCCVTARVVLLCEMLLQGCGVRASGARVGQ